MESGTALERRAAERLNLYLPVEVRSLEREESWRESSWTVNISRGGAYFLSSGYWREGERCEITIMRWPHRKDASPSPLFSASAEILRVDSLDNGRRWRQRWKAVAVRFDKPWVSDLLNG